MKVQAFEIRDKKLYEKLGQLKAPKGDSNVCFQDVKEWFKTVNKKRTSGLVALVTLQKGTTGTTGTTARYTRGGVDYLIPSRTGGKQNPNAVDCLSLGRLLEALGNNAPDDLPKVTFGLKGLGALPGCSLQLKVDVRSTVEAPVQMESILRTWESTWSESCMEKNPEELAVPHLLQNISLLTKLTDLQPRGKQVV